MGSFAALRTEKYKRYINILLLLLLLFLVATWPEKISTSFKQLFFLAKAQGQAKLVKNTKVIGNAVTLKNLDPPRSHVSYSIHTSFFFLQMTCPPFLRV